MAYPIELVIALVAGVVSILFALVLARSVLRLPAGDEKMQEISTAIREGAMAYLNRQFRTIAIAALILTVVVYFIIGKYAALAFVAGAGFSGIAAYIGMSVSVRTNVRTAAAASRGLAAALQVAFRGGAVNGMSIVG